MTALLGDFSVLIYHGGMKKQKLRKRIKKSLKSRKIIMAIVAVLIALSAFAQKEMGISMGAGKTAAALGIIGAYLFGEFKSDMARVRSTVFQGKKFRDPAFWSALLCSQLPVISEIFNLGLPVEGINSVVAFILSMVFKSRIKKLIVD